MKKLDIIGKTFNYLKVLSENFNQSSKNSRFYNCICLKCNNDKDVIVRQGDLVSGRTKSCGCLYSTGRNSRIYEPKEASARICFANNYNDGNLSFEEFFTNLTQQNCTYCGAEPSNTHNRFRGDKQASKFSLDNGDFIYNGLDRINSNLPHNIDNVIPACEDCNISKSDISLYDFVDYLICIHNIQKGLIK